MKARPPARPATLRARAHSAARPAVRRPAVLELDAEPVCDPVDVIEIGDDLVGVDDRAVIEPGATERCEIGLGERGGSPR